ncbi:ankyrin, partial [Anaeromyces robustus]
ACNNGNTHALTLLIDCGADMDVGDKDGNTPLHLSVLSNNKEMVKKLATRGCNREKINNDGKTAKGIAGLKGFTEIFEFLANFNNTLIGIIKKFKNL